MNCSLIILIIFIVFQSVDLFSQETGNKTERPSVGLVFSGGGAKGFAYIGLLRMFQEVGLPIDYIGGSSIGSIVGGFYALGYHPDSIMAMIRAQNWDDLLKDKVDRKYIAYEEKEYGEKTIISLPIKKKKISVSASMYQGQEVELLLNQYLSPAYKITDFNNLPTPFLCIGTDLFTGKEVLLDKGYLPMAIRASMSIPGYFSPVEYNGRYLVDGGVVNNYPVGEVRNMGAKIIIGGDVQHQLYDTKEQLSSIMTVLEQITSFYRVRANIIGDSLTDYKINYDVDYGILDFSSYDSIIAVGERVARSHYTEIKALADSLNAIEYRPMKKFQARPLDTLLIDSILFRGNKKLPDSYFYSILRKSGRQKIKVTDLQKYIRTIYGSGFFEKVTYSIENKGNKSNLIIDITDGGIGKLSAGIHFNNDYNVGLILGGSFRNVLGRNSKLFADLCIGPDPRLRVVYLSGLGGKAAIGIGADLFSFKFDLYNKDVKVNKITFTDYKGSLFFNYSFLNRFNFKTGFEYEYFGFSQEIHTDTTQDPSQNFSSYGTLFASLSADTRDRAYFPTRGFNATMRGEYVMPLEANWTQDLFTNSPMFFIKYDHNIPVSGRLVFQPGLFAGFQFRNEDSPPLQHIFGLGGSTTTNYIGTYAPFTGLQFIQIFGNYSAVARMKIQYNFYQKLYLTFKADAGAAVSYDDELFIGKNFLCGYGVTASYDSFIGPVELSVMGSNLNKGPLFFINIGFWF